MGVQKGCRSKRDFGAAKSTQSWTVTTQSKAVLQRCRSGALNAVKNLAKTSNPAVVPVSKEFEHLPLLAQEPRASGDFTHPSETPGLWRKPRLVEHVLDYMLIDARDNCILDSLWLVENGFCPFHLDADHTFQPLLASTPSDENVSSLASSPETGGNV